MPASAGSRFSQVMRHPLPDLVWYSFAARYMVFSTGRVAPVTWTSTVFAGATVTRSWRLTVCMRVSRAW